MKTLILIAMILTACGTDTSTDDDSIPYPATTDGAPDFSRWSRQPGAQDSCSLVETTGVLCQTKFTAGDKNCWNATFKFISIKAGYMYVQTKVIIVRQGEDHTLTFDEKPEIYNITDEFIEQYYHVFQCEGQNG